MAFVPGPTASRASGGDRGLLSRLETPTGIKEGSFVPVSGSNRDKMPAYPFVPVGDTNRDKRPPFCPGWCLQPGQKALAPLSPSAHLFLAVLGSGERSSCSFLHHICEKIFDSPVHPSALKVLGLFFSSSLACIAHFIL